MFGMGFMEILLVAVVAIIALGPEKLPSAMVDIAKMFKKFKGGLDEAKSTLTEELKVTEMKAEANKFKAQFEETKESMNVQSTLGFEDYGLKGDALDLKGLLEDDDDDSDEDDDLVEDKKVVEKKTKKEPKKESKKKEPKKAAFKTKKKKVTQEPKDEPVAVAENKEETNKFKVDFDEEENKSENS